MILVGAGDKAFVSGADISQFDKDPSQRRGIGRIFETQRRRARLAGGLSEADHRLHPGFCLGGGMQVAMLADIRIAAENSQFGIPAAKLGIAYGFDGFAIWSRWSGRHGRGS